MKFCVHCVLYNFKISNSIFINSVEIPWILRRISIIFMVSSKWLESCYCIPSGAELTCSVTDWATNISSSEWHTKNAVGHGSCNWVSHILSITFNVTKISCSKLPNSCRTRFGKQKLPFIWKFRFNFKSYFCLHCGKQWMCIKLNISISVSNIQWKSMSFQIVLSWNVWKLPLNWVLYGLFSIVITCSIAKFVLSLVHVKPISIKCLT